MGYLCFCAQVRERHLLSRGTIVNLFKWTVHPKIWKFCYHLVTHLTFSSSAEHWTYYFFNAVFLQIDNQWGQIFFQNSDVVANIQEDILKNVGNQTVLNPINFHCMDKNKTKQWKSIGPKTVWLPSFFRTSSFMFQRRNIVMFGNDMKVNKWWQHFQFFGWTITLSFKMDAKTPFNSIKKWYTQLTHYNPRLPKLLQQLCVWDRLNFKKLAIENHSWDVGFENKSLF